MLREAVDTLVGKDVEAYCGKCKADTWHAVTVVKNGKINKVLCKICNAAHAYKAPESAGTPVKAAATTRRRATGTPRTGRGKKDWGTLINQIEDRQVIEYAISGEFSTAPAIRHKSFGVGVITKVHHRNKIEVVFQEGTKILAQNLD